MKNNRNCCLLMLDNNAFLTSFAFWVNFQAFVVVKINFFKKFFKEHYQIVKEFGSRSGPTECRS